MCELCELHDQQYQQHVNPSSTKTWDYLKFWKFQSTRRNSLGSNESADFSDKDWSAESKWHYVCEGSSNLSILLERRVLKVIATYLMSVVVDSLSCKIPATVSYLKFFIILSYWYHPLIYHYPICQFRYWSSIFLWTALKGSQQTDNVN